MIKDIIFVVTKSKDMKTEIFNLIVSAKTSFYETGKDVRFAPDFIRGYLMAAFKYTFNVISIA